MPICYASHLGRTNESSAFKELLAFSGQWEPLSVCQICPASQEGILGLWILGGRSPEITWLLGLQKTMRGKDINALCHNLRVILHLFFNIFNKTRQSMCACWSALVQFQNLLLKATPSLYLKFWEKEVFYMGNVEILLPDEQATKEKNSSSTWSAVTKNRDLFSAAPKGTRCDGLKLQCSRFQWSIKINVLMATAV